MSGRGGRQQKPQAALQLLFRLSLRSTPAVRFPQLGGLGTRITLPLRKLVLYRSLVTWGTLQVSARKSGCQGPANRGGEESHAIIGAPRSRRSKPPEDGVSTSSGGSRRGPLEVSNCWKSEHSTLDSPSRPGCAHWTLLPRIVVCWLCGRRYGAVSQQSRCLLPSPTSAIPVRVKGQPLSTYLPSRSRRTSA